MSTDVYWGREPEPISLVSAFVLLHQFSEWMDGANKPDPSLTHEDLVLWFISQRLPAAMPALIDDRY